jgi:hypothetical protein
VASASRDSRRQTAALAAHARHAKSPILNDLFRRVSATPHTVIETNSVATLWARLRQGRWSSVMPQTYLALFGAFEGLPWSNPKRAISLAWRQPTESHKLDRQLAVA